MLFACGPEAVIKKRLITAYVKMVFGEIHVILHHHTAGHRGLYVKFTIIPQIAHVAVYIRSLKAI